MTSVAEAVAVLREMREQVSVTRRALFAADILQRQMPRNDDHSRIMEQITLTEERYRMVSAWADRLQTAIDAMSQGEAVAWMDADGNCIEASDKAGRIANAQIYPEWARDGEAAKQFNTPLYTLPPAPAVGLPTGEQT